MFLRLLQQQVQEFASAAGVAVVMGDQAAGQGQGVANGGAMVDLNRDVQRLACRAPSLLRLAL
ncbi:hypothetical protein D3C85_1919250 [compost metagenome]